MKPSKGQDMKNDGQEKKSTASASNFRFNPTLPSNTTSTSSTNSGPSRLLHRRLNQSNFFTPTSLPITSMTTPRSQAGEQHTVNMPTSSSGRQQDKFLSMIDRALEISDTKRRSNPTTRGMMIGNNNKNHHQATRRTSPSQATAAAFPCNHFHEERQ